MGHLDRPEPVSKLYDYDCMIVVQMLVAIISPFLELIPRANLLVFAVSQ